MMPLAQEGVLLDRHLPAHWQRVHLPPHLPLPDVGPPVPPRTTAAHSYVGEDRHHPAASPHRVFGGLKDGGGDALGP